MTTAYLSARGLSVPLKAYRKVLGAQFSNILKNLCLVCPQKIGPAKRCNLYKLETLNGIEFIFLPRFFRTGINKVELCFPPDRPINAILRHELFDNQQLIVEYLTNNIYTPKRLSDGTASCTLNLRAGMGKTFTAAGLIARLGLRTLYIVPKRPLMLQAVKDLKMCFYGDEPHPIVGAFESKPSKRDPARNYTNHDITVIVIDSALLQPQEFFTGYSLVVLDEVHSYCSEKRKDIFYRAQARAMFGISATTEDRADGFDAVFHGQLGEIVRAELLPGFTYEQVAFNCTVRAIKYNGPPEYTHNLTHEKTGRIFTPYMNKQFMEDPHRLRLIVRELVQLYNWRGENGQQHCIYVFCEERDPLISLKTNIKRELDRIGLRLDIDTVRQDDECPACLRPVIRNDPTNAVCAACNSEYHTACRQNVCSACGTDNTDRIGHFVGGIKDREIAQFRDNCRVLLTTYGYSGTGVSIDKMTGIIFATPRKANMKQILARVLRRSGDLTIPRVIVDIIDNKTAIKYQYGARSLAYDFYNMQIINEKIDYNTLL